MNTKPLLFVLAAGLLFGCKNHPATTSLTGYVNPMIGTSGHGHTFPGATVPFGMVQLSPDTYNEGWDWCSGYHYSDNSIMGFSHTHLSGTGRGELLDVLMMPTTGAVQFEPGTKENPDGGYRSRFSHQSEIAKPGYYSVKLDDYQVKAEITATTRAGGEPIISFQSFSTSTGHLSGVCQFKDISSLELVALQTVQFKAYDAKFVKTGDIVIMRHIYNYRPGFNLFNCSNVRNQDVTIHALPGMGVFGTHTKDIALKRFSVRPSGRRIMSGNVDATHFVS